MNSLSRIAALWLLTVSASAEVRGLADSVSFAVSANPDIQASYLDARVQAHELNIVESGFLPSLSVTAGIGREDSNNVSTRAQQGGGSEEMERRESGILLRQMLFDGFETHFQREGALQAQQVRRYELQDAMNQVAHNALEAHLELAKANRSYHFNMENLRAHQNIAEDITSRARSGKDDRAKVSQVKARLALAFANVEAAKNRVLGANARYLEVVGRDAGEELYFEDGLQPLPDSLAALLARVKQNNPLLLASMARRQVAKHDFKAAESVNYPELYFESGASWNDNLDGVQGSNRDAFFMFRVQYDLFKGGAHRAEKRKALALSERADYSYDAVLRSLQRQAREAWHGYQSSAARAAYLRDYKEAAEQTREAYRKQFNIGARSLIDVLDAENELLNAQTQLVGARKDLYLAKFEILVLQGNLLEVMDVSLPSALVKVAQLDMNPE